MPSSTRALTIPSRRTAEVMVSWRKQPEVICEALRSKGSSTGSAQDADLPGPRRTTWSGVSRRTGFIRAALTPLKGRQRLRSYLAPFADLPGADHPVQYEGVVRGELLGGLAGTEHRQRPRAVGERAEGEQRSALHELGVPGLGRREVLRREREV